MAQRNQAKWAALLVHMTALPSPGAAHGQRAATWRRARRTAEARPVPQPAGRRTPGSAWACRATQVGGDALRRSGTQNPYLDSSRKRRTRKKRRRSDKKGDSKIGEKKKKSSSVLSPPVSSSQITMRRLRSAVAVALVGLSSGAQALSTSRGVAASAFRPRAGVVRCAEPEWSPQEDWALQDQVKAYSAGTGVDTATFWTVLTRTPRGLPSVRTGNASSCALLRAPASCTHPRHRAACSRAPCTVCAPAPCVPCVP